MREKKGFSLVEIMVVVFIVALLSAIAIPNLLEARRSANHAAAKATLRSISAAIETYAAVHNGTYPTTEANLTTEETPPYLNKAYFTDCVAADPCGGYIYTWPDPDEDSYSITATPSSTSNGTCTYTIIEGGVLTGSPAGCV